MKNEKAKKRSLKGELFLKRNNEPKETRNIRESMKERGITLIALVITIIIMLILAGITLSTVLGENGLIERAKKASETYKKAEEEESKGIEQLIDEMDKVNGGDEETEPSPEPDNGHPPKVETVSAEKAYDESAGVHTITLKVTGSDEDGDELTYTVHYGTSEENYGLQATQTGTSGRETVITLSELDMNTRYYYKVTASDGTGKEDSAGQEGNLKTYCVGTPCDGPTTEKVQCNVCQRNGQNQDWYLQWYSYPHFSRKLRIKRLRTSPMCLLHHQAVHRFNLLGKWNLLKMWYTRRAIPPLPDVQEYLLVPEVQRAPNQTLHFVHRWLQYKH